MIGLPLGEIGVGNSSRIAKVVNQLIKIEPIPLPDLRKPTGTISLPGWLTTQQSALAENFQLQEGKFADVLTLPESLLPTETQKAAIRQHCTVLRLMLEQTPEAGDEWLQETLTVVTKMQLVLASQKASELAGEARAEAYMVALEDLPAWAVTAASKRWYRSSCGNNEHGKPYDYRFMPDPASMRRLAMVEAFRVKNRISDLEKVLSAVPFKDCSRDLDSGLAAWDGLRITMKSGPEATADLTFEKAVEIGFGIREKTGKGA